MRSLGHLLCFHPNSPALGRHVTSSGLLPTFIMPPPVVHSSDSETEARPQRKVTKNQKAAKGESQSSVVCSLIFRRIRSAKRAHCPASSSRREAQPKECKSAEDAYGQND